MCRREDQSWRHRDRRALGCTRDDLPAVKWDVDATRIGIAWMGRAPDPSFRGERYGIRLPEGMVHPQPPEDWREGCPGGWYRSEYVRSVVPYMRRRTEGGGRTPNPRFDRAPAAVVEAVLYLEAEQEACIQHREREAHARFHERLKAQKRG